MVDKNINNDKINLKRKGLLSIIFSIIGVLLVGTFAWFTWRSSDTALVLTVGDISGLNITLSPYKFNSSITPTDKYNADGNSYVQVISANSSSEKSYTTSLFYRINSIDTELVDSNFKYTIERSTDGTTYSSYKTGDFGSASSGTDYEILSNEELPAETTYYYRVYIWIYNEGDQSSMQGKIFDAELRADYFVEPNAPVLDNGMIPVTIANDGTVTTVAENDDSWYDYSNKQWANAVLVKDSGTKARSYYKNTPNIEVDQNDILAYYVWIPKYKYKIWIKDGTTTPQPQKIDIVFETENTVTKGSEVGDYMTHPAFIFGGEYLSGIWVGKFETSASSDGTCFETPSEDNCNNDNIEPRILPKVNALNYQVIGNQFITALKFSDGMIDSSTGAVSFSGSTIFGLATTTNSHMMKNSEWGAVTYLSHSKYGINTEIRINNYWSSEKNETGCGASESLANSTTTVTTCAIPYGSATSYPQSTTGNITGLFDMSGGLYENVMGNYDNQIAGSNFSVMPEGKYYDVYLSSIFDGGSGNATKCNLATCGGHALFETRSWYGENAAFVYSDAKWFKRGGYYGDGSGAGLFNFINDNGFSHSNRGFRVVLLVDM